MGQLDGPAIVRNPSNIRRATDVLPHENKMTYAARLIRENALDAAATVADKFAEAATRRTLPQLLTSYFSQLGICFQISLLIQHSSQTYF